ncbi:MAG TPA: kelch repeat-containing protein [Thermoanaerobaculia bacterium]|nr:kelch repeat-containing protein [Thermoanaerobaculia bacterium]
MADHSLKRSYFFFVLLLLTSSVAFADSPSGRYESRMVWDTPIHRAVLFGGSTAIDSGTKIAYERNDTWEWTGYRWLEVYPVHSPSNRAAHGMIFDSVRNRPVVFGGRQSTINSNGTSSFVNLNDTWSFDGTDWTQIQTADSPSVRELPGMVYDSARDRIVLFGGIVQTYTGPTLRILNETPLKDTWEFDGTDWHQIQVDGPLVYKPILAYDPILKQTIMIGYNNPTDVVTVMYAYDPVGGTWNQLKPALLPACANEGAMTFDGADSKILFTGATCLSSINTEDTYEWDGSNWTKITLTSFAGRYYGEALTYDPDHQVVVLFGGAQLVGPLLSATYTYTNTVWQGAGDLDFPAPRSLFMFLSDPVHNVIYLYGGLNDATSFFDFWIYQNGQFHPNLDGTQPSACSLPLGVFDTDRQKVVMFCSDSSTWEFDGAAWTQFDSSKTAPPAHEWGSLAYDQSLKKTVFFGGFDPSNNSYLDQTWTYDGTSWTQVTKNPPTSRSHASIWYDPTLKKTLIYGGIGRLTSTDRLTRYSDMWSFDGTGWTAVVPAATPGMRYGALTAIDPTTNHALIFGGIRVDTDPTNNQVQVYANDMWDWDGTKWTQINTAAVPPPRENAGLALDPLRNQLIMFGGYSGFYLSDVWTLGNGSWSQVFQVLNRRRAAAGH